MRKYAFLAIGTEGMIRRDRYLNRLIDKKENGLIKVITGIRRCGKSFLLFEIYHRYLNSIGVPDDHIIELALDDDLNARYRNPLELGNYVRSLISDDGMYYVFLDEIQKVVTVNNPYVPDGADRIGFVDVLLGLMKIKNADIYVSGSNSRMLSTDILTEFRGRGDEIRVHPLSFAEYYSACEDKRHAWRDFFTYGGMPLTLSQKNHEDKAKYLRDLFDKIYLDDIIARRRISAAKSVLDELLDVVSSSVGSLTNPSRIAKTFSSVRGRRIDEETAARYLDYFEDAFMLYKARRYDVKGRKYIGSPFKYYFSDVGLRNAILNFRQQEENHIMENIIYNELLIRGCSVDVGFVPYNFKEDGKSRRANLEVDFVANRGSKRYYIQSAFAIPDEEKRLQETRPLINSGDSFKKIIVVRDDIVPWHDEKGILYLGIEEFLLNEAAMDA